MPAPFAALEARVNAACLDHLANAVATLPDLTEVPGFFVNGAVAGGAFDVAPAFARSFTGSSAALDALEIDDEITIAGTDYGIAAIEPDGTGFTLLGLK